jgi:hypothetical protein
VVVELLLDGDELMLPLEPELLPDEPDEPEAPMPPVLLEPPELLLGLVLEEPLLPDLLELPDVPELPIEVPPDVPEEPLAESEPPLPQALRDRAATATTARTVLRERVDAFMRGNSW